MYHSDIGFDGEWVSVGYASEVFEACILSSQFFCEPKSVLNKNEVFFFLI